MLIGRMGWLAVAQNQKYQLLSESNRVQLIPVPPRRGWIIDRKGKPIAINRSSFRVDIIPQQLEKGRNVVPELARLLSLSTDDVDRISRDLKESRGFQPVQVAENVSYDQYAAVTVRLPDLPGVQATRGALQSGRAQGTGRLLPGQKPPTPPAAVAGAVLNIFLPGLGHLVQGRVAAALVWFLAVAVGYVFIVPGLILHVLSIISAARWRGNTAAPAPPMPA
jgi:hypothetical protein